MKISTRFRQIHRWLSIAFTIGSIINLIAYLQGTPAGWIGLLAFVPLVLLLLTGLYLFALPYMSKVRSTTLVSG